jgi:hypothetical protein
MKNLTLSSQNSFSKRNLSVGTMLVIIFCLSVFFNRAEAQTLYVTSGGTVVAQNAAVYIATNAIISSGTTPLTGATVSISSNFVNGQDVLGIDGATSGSFGSIAYLYNTTTGVLTLTGAESAANYQITLRKVTYTNTAALPNSSSRVITFSLNSALPYTGTGHFYEFISSTNISWTDAFAAANLRSYFGLQGYLATITSLDENTFVYSKINAAGWLGGSDAASEGVWKWVCGPESGTQFWQGGIAGSAVGGNFTYWHSAQPDNATPGEHYLDFWNGDHWNDYPNVATGSIAGYVVEYGGMAGDPLLHISDNVTVGFAPLVRNLVATGTAVRWHSAATGGTLYTGTEVLVNGQHYYASQTINGVESSSRLDVIANVLTVAAPTSGTHTPSQTQVVWNWNTVSGATGYKWNTTNNYSSASDLGTALTKTETGLTCNTSYSRYIWAYNVWGCVSSVTTLTQISLSCVWTGNLAHLRGNNGSYYDFLVTGTTTGSIWGCNGSYYTDDTNLATAAVHSGYVLNGQTKTVRVLILAGKSSYSSCTSNGITSSSYSSWDGSYQITGSW